MTEEQQPALDHAARLKRVAAIAAATLLILAAITAAVWFFTAGRYSYRVMRSFIHSLDWEVIHNNLFCEKAARAALCPNKDSYRIQASSEDRPLDRRGPRTATRRDVAVDRSRNPQRVSADRSSSHPSGRIFR